MRIFLDANILFSAAKFNGAIRRLLQLLREAGHEPSADAYGVVEAQRNLAVKTPVGRAALDTLLEDVSVVDVSSHRPLAESLRLHDKDRPVLASAIALKCDALVTGDITHFGHMVGTNVEGVAIHTPRSLAELLL